MRPSRIEVSERRTSSTIPRAPTAGARARPRRPARPPPPARAPRPMATRRMMDRRRRCEGPGPEDASVEDTHGTRVLNTSADTLQTEQW